ncbi:hypothetical protein JZ751_003819 [Albula glossodonta]|uniref:Uncharacterized protein n=1 Tax=Albula glossodonta TaxID=121402 RepID=A0A8T2P5J8_9TELE|nr:hypothetical protein JZ751_003819 [Albula glossodonta]
MGGPISPTMDPRRLLVVTHVLCFPLGWQLCGPALGRQRDDSWPVLFPPWSWGLTHAVSLPPPPFTAGDPSPKHSLPRGGGFQRPAAAQSLEKPCHNNRYEEDRNPTDIVGIDKFPCINT